MQAIINFASCIRVVKYQTWHKREEGRSHLFVEKKNKEQEIALNNCLFHNVHVLQVMALLCKFSFNFLCDENGFR